MSRAVRSKSLSEITPIIKAYPPKQPKEAPYRPMHPSLQNEFDASGAELKLEKRVGLSRRIELPNGDFVQEIEYGNNSPNGPYLNHYSSGVTFKCLFQFNDTDVKLLQIYNEDINQHYEQTGNKEDATEFPYKYKLGTYTLTDETGAMYMKSGALTITYEREINLTNDVDFEKWYGRVGNLASHLGYTAESSNIRLYTLYKLQQAQKAAENCAATDQQVNASISFVPSKCQIEQLREQAREAETTRAFLEEERKDAQDETGSYKDFDRGMQPLLSKLSFLDVEEGSDKWNEKNGKAEGKYRNPGLCPVSLNPDHTILARLARGDIAAPLRGYVWGSNDTLTVIDDRNMPLGGGSCGPNGILVDCNKEYGKSRINLFYPEDDWPNLLNDYLAFRNENVEVIFAHYCNKFREHDVNYKFDVRGPDKESNKLAVDLRPHYSKARKLLCAVEAEVNKGNKLSDLGIGVISFCQTWLRNDTRNGPAKVGNAQFSVMSPHFQTRFYVANGKLLSDALADNGDITLGHYRSYVKISEDFGKTMQKEYGTDNPAAEKGKSGQAFVHLDDLAAAIGSD